MKAELQAELKTAMKAREQVKVETIRSLISAITYEEIEKKSEPLPKEACLLVFQRELKKRKEELEFAEKAGRQELLTKLGVEMAVIENYLPKQLSPQDLEKTLTDMKASNAEMNMGVAMKALKEKFAGQYDSKMASEMAKKIFG